MTGSLRIGVIGASGDIGRRIPPALAATAAHQSQPITLVLAARRPENIADHTDLPEHTRIERTALDLRSRESVTHFATGLDLVINAAGPSHDRALTTATAVVEAGADYVDVGGPADASAIHMPEIAGGIALFHAGALPGASGLLPRWLLRRNPETRSLTVITGGRGSFTQAGAEDYLAGIDHGDVEPLAAWRNGERRSAAAALQSEVILDEFPDPVALFPYFDTDTHEIARRGGLIDATWYSAMVGDGVTDALRLASCMGLQAGSRWLRDASVATLAGHHPYVIILVITDTERALLRAPGEAVLAAEVAAAAATQVLAGRVPAGAHTAAAAVDVERMLTTLTRPASRCTLTISTAEHPVMMEEGVL